MKPRNATALAAATSLFAFLVIPAMAAENTPPPRTMAVSGQAEIKAVPDEAILSAGVVTQARDAAAALAANSRAMNGVFDSLKRITPFIARLLAARAAAALRAWVTTPAERIASSGTALISAWPETAIVRGGGGFIGHGRARGKRTDSWHRQRRGIPGLHRSVLPVGFRNLGPCCGETGADRRPNTAGPENSRQ